MFAGLNATVDSVQVVVTVDVKEPFAAQKIAGLQKVAQQFGLGSDADKNLEKWSKNPVGLIEALKPPVTE